MPEYASPSPSKDCCTVPTSPPAGTDRADPTPEQSGIWAVMVAIGAATAASACCWLPLLLLIMGVSAAGIGGIFETARPYLLVVAAAFLAVGFYLAYFRKPACKPSAGCGTTKPGSGRLSRISLWLGAVLVVILGLFPYYGGAILAGGEVSPANRPLAAQGDDRVVLTYHIEGMTCPACASGLEHRLTQVRGVVSATVSFDEAQAHVTATADPQVRTAVAAAIEEAGFAVVTPAPDALGITNDTD